MWHSKANEMPSQAMKRPLWRQESLQVRGYQASWKQDTDTERRYQAIERWFSLALNLLIHVMTAEDSTEFWQTCGNF